jgi:hypothetical protein
VRFFYLYILIFCSGIIFQVNAQSNLKQKKIVLKGDTVYLDSLSLIPGSIKISLKGNYMDTSFYKIIYPIKGIVFKNNINDTVIISYKTFAFNYEKSFFHKNKSILTRDLSLPQSPISLAFSGSEPVNDGFISDGLNKNGSISRGISFGNNQDVVVNSSLNLQVSGKLSQDVDILLAATDDNIPFQADGTTAQLQEFDKVFVQLSNKTSKLIVGDFQLQKPNGYFMNFYKRSQGLYFANNYNDTINKKTVTFKTQLSGAVSKGKFARNIIQGVENNQGPYRLKGADNELFIITLSGTERIYIDGRLLQRGQEHDYIIDYNTSEITFTAKQIITKDKRIIVEMQYAERNYARSLYFFSEEVDANKLKLRFNFFGEQDNKNKTLQQSLTEQQKLVLFNVGDTLSKSVSSGAELAPFNTSDIFYWKKDTIVGVTYNNIYVRSENADSAKYRVKFSYVGEQVGNYVQVLTTANGKVYKWVVPLLGVPQGNYEPVIPLVTPKQKQMLTIGGNYIFDKNHNIDIEGVYTKNDINTYSPYNSYNNDGYGIKLASNNQTLIKSDTAKKKSVNAIYNIGYEYVQRYFNPIERYRAIEFERDWNRPTNAPINTDQHVGIAQVGLQNGSKSKLLYGISIFDEGSFFKGLKHSIASFYKTKNGSAEYNGSYLTSNYNLLSSNFYRHKTLLSKSFWKLRLNVLDEFEQNKFKKAGNDSLTSRSYQLWEWETNITNKDTSGNLYKIFYRERRDMQAYSSVLKDSTFAKNTGFSANINSIRNHPFSVIFTYRELQLKNANPLFLKPDNTLLSRLEYSPRLFHNFITTNLFYETGYGLENKKEYYFLLVAAGQGTYAWKDYNDNGIKETNEFEIAQFSDQALYIKVYTPTNQYVKVLHDQFSFSLNLRPSVFLKDSNSNALKFVSRFATQTVYRIDKKSSDNGQLFTFNPFDINLHDSLLTALNSSFRQSLFFNQSAAVFGMDYTFQNNLSKQLNTNGFETRGNTTHEWRWRLNFTRAWSINSTNIVGIKQNASEFLTSRNYKIEYYDLEQKLSYQPNTTFRLSLIYKYNHKQNIINEGFQIAELNDFGLEFKYNQLDKGSLTGKLNFIQITYNDLENSAIAYEMLNALKIGSNYTWGLSYQRNLSNNLQISINYDGRKSANSKIINIGGAQVRAFF